MVLTKSFAVPDQDPKMQHAEKSTKFIAKIHVYVYVFIHYGKYLIKHYLN